MRATIQIPLRAERFVVSKRGPLHLSQARFISTSSNEPTKTPSPVGAGYEWWNPPRVKAKPQIIFSGIQPTGVPHLGNYLGALKNWKMLQDETVKRASVAGSDDCPPSKLIFSVVDLHAITIPRPPGDLVRQKRMTLAALLALGLSPKHCTLFYQSSVPQHSELQWILSCSTSTGQLSRMTQWKSKLSLGSGASTAEVLGLEFDADGKERERHGALKHGLFSYPILQAADVLVYRATHVPVGGDQQQHLEFVRVLSGAFGKAYGKNILPRPKTILSPIRRIQSLRSPTKKMSKSDPDEKSRIDITDTAVDICSKIGSALTDSDLGPVSYDPFERHGVSNLIEILAALRGGLPANHAAQLAEGKASLKDLKNMVADAVCEELEGVGERYQELLERNGGRYLDDVAEKGAEKARESAEATMKMVRKAVGLA